MKSAIYLDAHVLACPPSEEGLDSFLEYITNLVSWRELRQHNWIDVYISRNAAHSLAEANAYPPYPELLKTITAFGIQHIQPKDVVDLINGFLQKSHVIEDEMGIDDLLFENFNLNPFVPYKARRASFPYHFELLAVLISMHRTFITDINNQLLLTSPDLKYFGPTKTKSTVTALTKTTNELIPDDIVEPLAVEAQFFLCKCIHSLNLGTNPCAVWANAKGEIALRKAIELYIYQDEHNGNSNINVLSKVKYSFGIHFLQSCRKLGFFDELHKINLLLRACSETLLNMKTHETHWIRTSSGGNAPQLKRGNDAAWRRNINHEYHLHYWTIVSGFEFSVVVPHSDCTIPLD